MIDAQLEALKRDALALVAAIEAQQNGRESGLADVLTADARDLVQFTEGAILGRGVTLAEAFLLGRMLQGYGIRRAKEALEKKRKAKDPVRHAYGLIFNAAMGKPAAQVEVTLPPSTAVQYPQLDDG
jgi:hypothetical protein